MNPRYKYYGISAISLLIIAFSIYYLLGGTKDFVVAESGGAVYDIVGKPYKGRYSADSARVIFEDLRSKVQTGEWTGDLVEIAYSPETGDQVNQFFGVLLRGTVTEIQGNYQLKRIRPPQILQVRLGMHPLVRPSREKVEAKISGYAQERGLELEDFFLHRYLPDNSVVVEAFVKP